MNWVSYTIIRRFDFCVQFSINLEISSYPYAIYTQHLMSLTYRIRVLYLQGKKLIPTENHRVSLFEIDMTFPRRATRSIRTGNKWGNRLIETYLIDPYCYAVQSYYVMAWITIISYCMQCVSCRGRIRIMLYTKSIMGQPYGVSCD